MKGKTLRNRKNTKKSQTKIKIKPKIRTRRNKHGTESQRFKAENVIRLRHKKNKLRTSRSRAHGVGSQRDKAIRRIQATQRNKASQRAKEREAHNNRFSRKASILKVFEELPGNITAAPELVNEIFDNENFVKSPTPDKGDIPTIANAREILREYGFDGVNGESNRFIMEWFKAHINKQKKNKSQQTKREAQINFSNNNRQMKSFLKKRIENSISNDTIGQLLFPNNDMTVFNALPWYVVYGILNEIKESFMYPEDIDYEAAADYISMFNPDVTQEGVFDLLPEEIYDYKYMVDHLNRLIKDKLKK